MRRAVLMLLMLLSILLVIAGVIWLLQRPAEPTIAAVTPSAADRVRRITVEELRSQLAASNAPLVWEFRSPETYAQGHVLGSRLMTLDEISDAAANLDQRQAIVALCS